MASSNFNLSTPRYEVASCPQVLEAVARITQADSSEMMRQRFVEALADTFPVTGVRFLTPGSGGRLNEPLSCEIKSPKRFPKIIWDREPRRNILATGALARCLESRQHVYPEHSPNMDYFPITASSGVIEILEIRQQFQERAERSLFRHVVQIYSNFIRVLFEREVDEMTGVYNRGAFDSQLNLLANSLRGQPAKGPLAPKRWLLLLDVDKFKPINDRFGHQVGDEVLLLVAQHMKTNFRGVDKVYRYGGEEFAVILSACTRDNAMKSAERLRHRVETSHFPQVGQITISGGLAAIDRFDHVANIVGRADQALYRAKREGRNRICEFDQRRASSLRPGLQSVPKLEIFS